MKPASEPAIQPSPGAKKAVISAVEDLTLAEAIVRKLRDSGFAHEDISILLAARQSKANARERRASARAVPLGVGLGAGIGGLTGMAFGVLTTVTGTLVLPGAGLIEASGMLLAALQGAQAGVLFGTISGALIGLGIPEAQARYYERRVRRGDLLISVQAETDAGLQRAEQIFAGFGADHIWSAGGALIPKATQAP